MQAVNPTYLAKMTGNGNLEKNGLYALLKQFLGRKR